MDSSDSSQLVEAMQGTALQDEKAMGALTISITAFGVSGSLSLDTAGQLYGSFGRTSFPGLLSGSFTYSTIQIDNPALLLESNNVQLQQFMKGANFSVGGGVMGYGGYSRSPGVGRSYDIGVGIGSKLGPQVPVSGGWQVTPKCFNC